MERSGVVLAGGRGSRLGADKPLVPLDGQPLVARAVALFSDLCDETLVMGGPDAGRLAPHVGAARVVADAGEGPLVALVEAARHARGERLLVVPADMPRVDGGVFAALLEAAAGREGAVSMVEGRLQPLVAVYARAALLREGARLVAAGGRAAWELARALDPARVDVDAALVADIDTPDDLARARGGQ